MERQTPLVAIVGPTAVGKTAVAVEVASYFATEIVSADSRQVYRLLDIGSGKPTREEGERVTHHLIDVADPDEDYSAARFREEAGRAVQCLSRDGKIPFLVGGCGFYVRALIDGIFAGPGRSPEIRASLQQEAREQGREKLYERLVAIDPEAASRIHPHDLSRVSRALEVNQLTGERMSQLKRQTRPGNYRPVLIGLRRERAALYARINARVERMLANGWLGEVRDLLARGYGGEHNALQSVGYRELVRHLRKELPWEEVAGEIQKASRRYAKRQLTWFQGDSRIRWLDLESEEPPAQTSERINKILAAEGLSR